MAGVSRALLAAAAAACSLAWGQTQQDENFKQAGVCARCHVISVVEWSISKHPQAGADCVACHGKSEGHVIDERNNIKPEHIPHGEAIAGMCASCHGDGCPKTRNKASCQKCHHYHALVNPEQPAVAKDDHYEELAARWARYRERMAEGERKVQARDWSGARAAFQAALKEKPGDPAAAERERMCGRRLKATWPGFEIAGSEYDERTGLPRKVKVAGLGIPMVLAPGGEFEMGSDRLAMAKPAHTVRVEPFYLGERELTQAEWTAIMGGNPSTHQGAGFPEAVQMPVDSVSWADCQEMIARLNARVAGGGFRLPTEAEWEFAAKQGKTAAPPLTPEAKGPAVTGRTPANQFGLFDLLGNVWEWTSSLAKPYPYDPRDGREDPAGKGLRVLRGGSFSDAAEWLDPSARHSDRPERRLKWNGVRLARSVPD
jgi:formylglycine-generating enzyme required for sulfatase activity